MPPQRRHRPRAPTTVLTELQKVDLPRNVRTTAVLVYEELPITVRTSMNRRAIIFYLLYTAYARLDIYRSTRDMAVDAGVREKAVSGIITSISLQSAKDNQTMAERAVNVMDPVTLVRGLCRSLTEVHVDHIPLIEQFVQRLLIQEPALQRDFPQRLAAASILLYLESFGVCVDDAQFAQTVGVSETRTVLRKLRKLMNSQ